LAAPDGAFLALEFVFLFVLDVPSAASSTFAFIGSPGKRAFCGRLNPSAAHVFSRSSGTNNLPLKLAIWHCAAAVERARFRFRADISSSNY